jgi:putative ATPase
LGEQGALKRLIERNQLRAAIFWGPPGCGKTTVAEIIAQKSQCVVRRLSAVSAGVKELREVLHEAETTPVLMFIDEVHRLNKNQQDVLLPALEHGTLRWIGATTENPSFSVNNALLSRTLVFRFRDINPQACVQLLRRALQEDEQLKQVSSKIDDTLIQALANCSGGDARRALSLLEAVIQAAPDNAQHITQEDLKNLGEDLSLYFDRAGDSHYDVASALIKSIRASQPDAALHYLARMIDGGERPEFIARRLRISASEDIGNANPHMLSFSHAAAEAVAQIGMPESRIILGQLVTLLACSPKSNRAYLAIDKALQDVKKFPNTEVPLHLRNAASALMKEMGYGRGYIYAHDDPEGAARLEYLPKELKGRRYYEPSDAGYERNLKQNKYRHAPSLIPRLKLHQLWSLG